MPCPSPAVLPTSWRFPKSGIRHDRLPGILVLGVLACLQPRVSAQTWFSPYSFWQTKVTSETPSADQSDATRLYNQWRYNSSGVDKTGSNWQSCFGLNNAVWTATASDTPIKVTDPNGANYYMDPIWAAVPWPANAVPSTNSDHHCVIWKPSTNEMWEFWNVTGTYPAFHASWGAYLANVTNSDGILPNPYGATASGLPVVGGMVTLAEGNAIVANPTSSANLIPHVVQLNLPQVDSSGYLAPATRNDGQNGPNKIKEGRRFRLPANVTVPAGPPLLRALVIAARDYGMVVRDCTGTSAMICVYGETPKPGDANPWATLIPNWQGSVILDAFPWNQAQVLDPIAGKGLVDGARYQFAPVASTSSCLNVYGSGGFNGDNVNVWPYYGGNVQLWTAQKQTDGSFELIPGHAPGMRLHVSGAGGTGSNVDIWQDTSADEEHWVPSLMFDGTYSLHPQHVGGSGTALYATGTAQGSNVDINTYWSQAGTRWIAVRR